MSAVSMLRCLTERKKLTLFFLAIYCVLFHFAYRRLWNDGLQAPMRTDSGASRMLMSFWNKKQLFSLSDVLIDRPSFESTHTEPVIAIGSGITSRKLRDVSEKNVGSKFLFFYTFLPTFCRTASPGFVYKFYLAYDHSDRVFASQPLRDAFQRQFHDTTTSGSCRDRGITTNLTLVQCDHAGKPTWAQNDAMLEAYLDHVDYFYRINDDTKMLTSGWTEKFISTLEGYDPPRIGVVGPKHSGGNVAILTYDFVHRTHVDIFGFYYPRLFTDWWGDRWITRVYKPNRSTKLNGVRLAHTLALGQRYSVRYQVEKHIGSQLTHDTAILNRYIEAVKRNKATGVKPDGRKVISMSLYGKDPRYTWGVIRNAQLVPVYLPEWTLRVYVTADPEPSKLAVPPRIINKLRLLGAEIVTVPTGNSMAPRNWRLLAAIDQQLDYFLVRDADARLSEREATAVREWVSATEKNESRAVIHCIRDHPKHTNQAIVDGLWGGRPRPLHPLLAQLMDNVTSNASSSFVRTSSDMRFSLDQLLAPSFSAFSYCHDSVSPCDRWTSPTSRRSFPLPRQGQEYIGQKFDAHQQLVSTDGDQLKADIVCEWSRRSSEGTSLHRNLTD